ncbi:DNA topoisomerase, partial [Acinetobacter baumannii]|nr:DNA topoisomerase [Acinetobacter baumannii]
SANKKTQRSRKQPLPYITSTLQQEASTKLGFAAKRTMSIAQRLYEGVDVGNGQEGLITYMRTDSTRLSDVFISAARKMI